MAYSNFIRVHEVYSINVQFFFCINILITSKNPYMTLLLLQINFAKGHETERPCTIRGPGNELETCFTGN